MRMKVKPMRMWGVGDEYDTTPYAKCGDCGYSFPAWNYRADGDGEEAIKNGVYLEEDGKAYHKCPSCKIWNETDDL